jgi:hypothetical protein
LIISFRVLGTGAATGIGTGIGTATGTGVAIATGTGVAIAIGTLVTIFPQAEAFVGAAPRLGKFCIPRSIFMGPVSVRSLGGTYFCPAEVEESDKRLPMRTGSSLITGVVILVRMWG